MDQKAAVALCCAAVLIANCGSSAEARLGQQFASQTTGTIRLPSGTVEINRELIIAPGASGLEITGSGTLLKAGPNFQGRALIVAENVRGIRLHDFSIDGRRGDLSKPLEMVPPENALRVWYPNNGILADRVTFLEVANLKIANVVNFPILVSRSSQINIHDVTVEDSGSQNAQRRNNLSGGILIEEGSKGFEVRDSVFRRILGNALWTHSLRTSPRLDEGAFRSNQFEQIGRDAIQVGHAARVRVEGNSGQRIGYPFDAVDVENGGTPVALDTAGNVDQSTYADNRFDEVNGKCIDLDGFHDGAVRGNTCTNRKTGADYPHGHFGIVMNNSDPDAHSQNIELSDNTIDGAKYGGLFLMGSGNRITNNRFLRLDLAQCHEGAEGCRYKADEPRLLESGIYLGRGVARLEETRANIIRGNIISSPWSKEFCIFAGPGVSLAANALADNTCKPPSP